MASNPTDRMDTLPRPAGAARFGARSTARRSKVGLDVLLVKAAVDFQNLAHPPSEAAVRENLESLRDAAGLDSIFIATYCPKGRSIESVIAATSLLSPFNPAVLIGEPLERMPYLRNRLE